MWQYKVTFSRPVFGRISASHVDIMSAIGQAQHLIDALEIQCTISMQWVA